MDATQYVISGQRGRGSQRLTVYAVPQVFAATLPIGLVSTQVGTLVKLMRVLMLGPVVVLVSLLRGRPEGCADITAKPTQQRFSRLVPWFIVGFLLLGSLRSLGFVPDQAVKPITYASASAILTIISMAALGLGVDVRVIGRLGPRVIFAVTASLIVLFIISIVLIWTLRIG